MKRLFFLALPFVLGAQPALAQDIPASQVPQAVQQAVTARYADAHDIDWEMKGNHYEAEVDRKGQPDIHLLVDGNGRIVAEKHEIKDKRLPAGVEQSIKSKYSGYRVDDVDRIVRDGKTYYQVELDAPMKQDLHLVFSENGSEHQMDYWH